MKQKVSLEGLKVRPSYDEMISQLDKPIIDKYPDRKATQLRFSNWLSQLDSDGVKSLEQQQLTAMKEQHKQNLLK